MRVDKNERFDRSEFESLYPLTAKIFGVREIAIYRVSGPGLSCAHMLFIPDLERPLQDEAKLKLWEQFIFSITAKRKPKRARLSEKDRGR